MWEVEYTDEFGDWWEGLSEQAQVDVAAHMARLESQGPQFNFPYSSGILSSKISHLRELRMSHRGQPLRVLYAFDPRRSAILLVGGNKAGDKQ